MHADNRNPAPVFYPCLSVFICGSKLLIGLDAGSLEDFLARHYLSVHQLVECFGSTGPGGRALARDAILDLGEIEDAGDLARELVDRLARNPGLREHAEPAVVDKTRQ